MSTTTRVLFAVLLLCALGATAQEAPKPTAAEARKIIAEGNVAWGKARVALDKEAFERMLAPDFYVQLFDRRLTRQQFLERISSFPPGSRLTRFDASVITVQPKDDGWVAVIHEKLEAEHAGPDGKVSKSYSLWITRDGWKKLGDRWVITFSEAIGTESWREGATPPFLDW